MDLVEAEVRIYVFFIRDRPTLLLSQEGEGAVEDHRETLDPPILSTVRICNPAFP